MKVNVTNEGLKYGLILGLLTAFILYGSWAMGIDTFLSVNSVITFVPYIVVTLIIVGLKLRKQNGNVLEFKDALKFAFLTYVIVAVITAVATYILYNIIDETLTERSFAVGLEKTRSVLEKLGMPDDKIDEAITKAESEKQETGFRQIFLGQGLFLIWDFVKSLLITIAIKRERKVEFEGQDNI